MTRAPAILLVDPCPESLARLAETFGTAGYGVQSTGTLTAALEGFRREAPDLIVVGPGPNSQELQAFCHAVRAHRGPAEIPVICLLEAADPTSQELPPCITACLRSPIRADALLAEIARHLALAQAHRKLADLSQEADQIKAQLRDQLQFRLGAQTILDEAPVLVFALDLAGRFLFANRAVATPLGTTPEAMEGQTRESFFPPEVATALRSNDQVVLNCGAMREFEEHLPGPHGETIFWSVKFPLKGLEGQVIGVGGISSDITQVRRLEQDRARLTDLYATLSQANKAILKSQDEAELMQEICRVCVEFGRFDLAWIGAVEGDQVLPVASFGPCSAYLSGLEIHLEEKDPLGQGPTGTSLREKRTVVCHDWTNSSMIAPWKDRGVAFGIESSASFPVLLGGAVIRVLTIYSKEAGFFQPDRIALLEELAQDLGYAHAHFREEANRRAAEAALAAERMRYEHLVNTIPSGIYRIHCRPGPQVSEPGWETALGPWYQVEFVSDRFCEILGITREAFTVDPTLLAARLHPKDRDDFLARRAEVIRVGRPFQWEGRLDPALGNRWVRFESFPNALEGGAILWTGVLTDITEQRATREQVDRQFAVLSSLQESADGPVFSLDRDYRYTSFNRVHAEVMKALYGCDIGLGKSLLECQSVREDRDIAQANLDRALAGEHLVQESVSGEEARTQRHFLVSHNPIRSADGRIVGVAVFAQDITERKHTEESLRRISDLLRHSDSLARVGGWEIDLQTQELFWTDEIYHIYEVDPAEYQPTVQSSLRFYAPESLPVITQAVEEAIRSGRNFDLELGLITGKGRRIHVHATSEVLYDNGKPVKLIGAFQDITDIKKASELLRRTSDLLNQSESLAKVGGWEVDLEANTLFWTDETYRIHDLEPGEFQPAVETAIPFYAPEWRTVIADAVQKAIECGANFNLELELITAKGRRIWVHTTSSIVRKDGRVAKIVGAFRDISSERATRSALEKSRERYRLLTENARDVVWTLDAETRMFTYVSPSVERLRGYTPEEILRKPLDAALSPEGAEFVASMLKSRIDGLATGTEGPGIFHVEELEQPCKDGSTVWTEVVSSYFVDGETGHASVLGVTRDITERRKAQLALAESEAFARSVLDSLSAHVAVVDETGRILAVNRAWEKFAEENGGNPADHGVGANYYQACAHAGGPDAESALRTAAGIREVIAGTVPGFEIEYPCHAPSESRWFAARVTRFPAAGSPRAVIAHESITERKLALDEVVKREEQFRTLATTSPTGIFRTDAQGRTDFWNQCLCDMTGLRLEEVLGTGWAQAVHPEERESVFDAWSSCTREERSFRMEIRFTHTNGTVLSTLAQAEPVRDSAGKISAWVGTIHDITDLRTALSELRSTRDYLENLLDCANAPIIVWDPDFRITRFNHAFERMTDYTAEEMLGRPLESLFPPSSTNATIALIAQTAQGGSWESVEIPVQKKDGSPRIALWNSANLFAEDGATVLATIAQGQDITERKRIEESLAASETRHRAVVETAADGLVLLDRESARILDANPAFCAMYGYSLEELRTMTAMDVSAEKEKTQENTRSGAARVGLRWHRRKDGTVFPVELVANGFQEGGSTINVVSVRDISDRLALEEELLRLNQDLEHRVIQRTAELESTNRELESFAYSVSHDLRAPLRAIAGFSSALKEDYSPKLAGEGQEYLDRIQGGAIRMGQLIDDLLRLSRVGRGELITVPVDLAPMVKEALARLQEADSLRQVEVRMPDSMETSCDPRLMRILLENLLGNAWKFTSKTQNPVFTLGFSRRGDGGHDFSIRDNGVGFSMERAGKLFSPFHRMHPAEEFPGTGIGLAIVQRIVTRHGGTIRADSQPGEGATFVVSLPPPAKEDP